MSQQLDPAIFGSASRSARRCSAPGCERDAHCRGYCQGHYLRWKRGADLTPPVKQYRRHGQARPACSEPGCHREAHSKGLCPAHLRRQQKGRESDKAIQPRRARALTCDFGVRVLRETTAVLDRQAAAIGVKRSELVRTILENWVKDVTARRRERAQ